MRFDYDICMKEGLLRKVPPSKDKSVLSFKKAKNWLEEASKALKARAFNSSIISSYLAMFHSARAILFFDGYREKSHACIARYLEEKYTKKKLLEIRWIELLDHYRELRHGDQYNLTFYTTEKEAKEALNSASGFVERMGKLFKEVST